MKKIFLGVFIAVVMFFTVWGIIYVSSPINSIDAVTDTIENAVNDKTAVIIREEEVYSSDIDGTLYCDVSEGDRVAKDSVVCTVFGGQISDDNLNELKTIDKKINHRREKLRETTIYTGGGADAESKIAGIIKDIASTGEKNDVIKIADCKEDLNNLRSGVQISDEEILESLILEKKALESRISTGKSEITTDMAGMFTTYIDGLESALNPEGIAGYTLEYLNSLAVQSPQKLTGSFVEKDGIVCKIVNNHVWYAAIAVPTEIADNHKVGEEVTLRFNSVAGQTVGGTIYRISENDENGSKLVVVKCSVYFEGAFSYRQPDMDLIFESYTGFKVPVHAIRSDESGKQYVIGAVGSKEYTCYCDILYTDAENEFVIIQSSKDAQTGLDSMERIVIGER